MEIESLEVQTAIHLEYSNIFTSIHSLIFNKSVCYIKSLLKDYKNLVQSIHMILFKEDFLYLFIKKLDNFAINKILIESSKMLLS